MGHYLKPGADYLVRSTLFFYMRGWLIVVIIPITTMLNDSEQAVVIGIVTNKN